MPAFDRNRLDMEIIAGGDSRKCIFLFVNVSCLSLVSKTRNGLDIRRPPPVEVFRDRSPLLGRRY